MVDTAICQRNKFGFCKYNLQCKLTHSNDICDSQNCKVSQCKKRHPKECLWFRDFGRCKFFKCAYKHLKKRTIESDFDDITKKIKILEAQIKNKETEENVQAEIVNNLERKQRENILEERVRVLETFVVRLEEKLEMLEQDKKGADNTDYSTFDHLHTLIRSNSLEIKCDECDHVSRNKARLAKHKQNNHTYICEICKEWDDGFVYRGEAEFAKHNHFIHETHDKTLTDKEYEELTENYARQINNGPETPKRENWFKRNKEKEKRDNEERKRVTAEERKKVREEQEKKKKKEEEEKKQSSKVVTS